MWNNDIKSNQKILIVDDHEIVHSGLKLLLSPSFHNVEIDSAFDGDEALKMIKNKKYNLIILDYHMPNTETFNLVRLILSQSINQKILIFSMVDEELFGMRLLKMGVQGFLSKNCKSEKIVQAVQTVLNGSRYISQALTEIFANDYLNKKSNNTFASLTDRETQVLKHLVNGLGGKEISKLMNIHTSTIGTHKAHIYEKLGVTNIIELRKISELNNINFI